MKNELKTNTLGAELRLFRNTLIFTLFTLPFFIASLILFALIEVEQKEVETEPAVQIKMADNDFYLKETSGTHLTYLEDDSSRTYIFTAERGENLEVQMEIDAREHFIDALLINQTEDVIFFPLHPFDAISGEELRVFTNSFHLIRLNKAFEIDFVVPVPANSDGPIEAEFDYIVTNELGKGKDIPLDQLKGHMKSVNIVVIPTN